MPFKIFKSKQIFIINKLKNSLFLTLVFMPSNEVKDIPILIPAEF